MKLSFRLAGLCASATFILVGFPGLFQRLSPFHPELIDTLSCMDLLEPMLYTLVGTLLAGFIGFQIGAIMERPAGPSKKKNIQEEALPTYPSKSSEMSALEKEEMAAMEISIGGDESALDKPPPSP